MLVDWCCWGISDGGVMALSGRWRRCIFNRRAGMQQSLQMGGGRGACYNGGGMVVVQVEGRGCVNVIGSTLFFMHYSFLDK